MAEMIRILIADGSEVFRTALAEVLRPGYAVETCQNGMELMEAVLRFRPDILVLDLMLPWKDGLTVLHTLREQGISLKVLATTSFTSEYLMESLQKLGVDYVVLKPCDIQAVTERLTDLAVSLTEPVPRHRDRRETVSAGLLRLGISRKRKGFECAREAILLFAEDPEQSVTKELYPAVASRLGHGNGRQVEKDIRAAIEEAWNQRNDRVWRTMFPGMERKPTNKVFVFRMSELLLNDGDSTRG